MCVIQNSGCFSTMHSFMARISPMHYNSNHYSILLSKLKPPIPWSRALESLLYFGEDRHYGSRSSHSSSFPVFVLHLCLQDLFRSTHLGVRWILLRHC